MDGDLYTIPPNGDMTEVEYKDSVPTLEEIHAMLDSGQVGLVRGFVNWEKDGVIVPAAAICNGEGKSLGLPLNDAGMMMCQVSMMRTGTAPGAAVSDPLYGNIVVGCGDPEFMQALRDLFPQPTPPT